MDQLCLQAVEAYIHAGLPVDAAAALLVEVVGLPHGVEADVERIVEIATGTACARCASPRTTPSGRCCGRAASRRSARSPASSRTTTCTTRSCREHSCPRCWPRCTRSPPATSCWCSTCSTPATATCTRCSCYDAREPGVMERVHAAGEEIVRVSVEAGGVLSGEHGIGLEKRDYMPLMFSDVDLARPGRAARGVRPVGLRQPRQGAAEPGGVRRHPVACRPGRGSDGAWISPSSPRRSATTDPVTIAGLATRGGPVDGVRVVMAPGGDRLGPAGRDDGAVRRGHAGRRARRRARRRTGRRSRSRRAGRSAARSPSAAAGSAGSGTGRSATRCCRRATSRPAGDVVKAGGPTVKNVSGFDLCRLLVGSRGTLGFLGEVILRTRPRARVRAVVQWTARPARRARSPVPADRRCCGTARTVVGAARGPRATTSPTRRPGSALQPSRRSAGAPDRGTVVDPAGAPTRTLTGRFVAEIGVGVVHHERRAAGPGRRSRARRPPPPHQATLRPDRPAQPRASTCSSSWMADRPFVDRPPGPMDDVWRAAGRAAAAWRLPAPELVRVGMNATFVAGDVVLRVGRPTAPPEAALALAGVLAGQGSGWPRRRATTWSGRAASRSPCGSGWCRREPMPTGTTSAGWWPSCTRSIRTTCPPATRCRGANHSRGGTSTRCSRRSMRCSIPPPRAGIVAAIERHRGWRADERVVSHGDVHPDNVMATAGGTVLLDWDLLCAGPPAWDHAMLLRITRWGWPARWYDEFAAGYGRSLAGDSAGRADRRTAPGRGDPHAPACRPSPIRRRCPRRSAAWPTGAATPTPRRGRRPDRRCPDHLGAILPNYPSGRHMLRNPQRTAPRCPRAAGSAPVPTGAVRRPACSGSSAPRPRRRCRRGSAGTRSGAAGTARRGSAAMPSATSSGLPITHTRCSTDSSSVGISPGGAGLPSAPM